MNKYPQITSHKSAKSPVPNSLALRNLMTNIDWDRYRNRGKAACGVECSYCTDTQMALGTVAILSVFVSISLSVFVTVSAP